MHVNTLLPHTLDVGRTREWYLPESSTRSHDADPDEEQQYLILVAQFLGLGTSHANSHSNHMSKQFVDRGTRCNACRWFEIRIFREVFDKVDDQDEKVTRRGGYVIHTTGCSIVSNEQPLYKTIPVTSPYSVVEELTTRRITDNGPEAFITKPSANALAEAAGWDEALREAYVDRAVS